MEEKAMLLILEERAKQKKNYTTESDRFYSDGELVDVARCVFKQECYPVWWPESWSTVWYKKFTSENRIRQLSIAGALLLAHMEAFGSDAGIDGMLVSIQKELINLL